MLVNIYDLSLRHILVFNNVAETLSMSKSAQNLYVTQPAVSQTIKDIENKFGVKLFIRKGHKLKLTPEGKELYVYTKRIMNLMEGAQLCLENFNSLNKGYVTVGASSTIGNYILPNIIKGFKEHYPNISINSFIGNTHQVIYKLRLCDVGVGLIEGLPDVDDKEIRVRKFMKDEIVFFCSPQHPFASREKVKLDELESGGFISREDGSGTRQVIEKHLKDAGVKLKAVCEFNSSEAIKNAVIYNLGFSALSKWIIRRELELGVVTQIDVEGLKISRWFYLLEIGNHNKAQDVFVDYIFNCSEC